MSNKPFSAEDFEFFANAIELEAGKKLGDLLRAPFSQAAQQARELEGLREENANMLSRYKWTRVEHLKNLRDNVTAEMMAAGYDYSVANMTDSVGMASVKGILIAAIDAAIASEPRNA